ncbi:cyclin domain-containing protein [Pilobolus umbonatus]|nr:cyclin domain-containing protein [Pilobolus umbonatus]
MIQQPPQYNFAITPPSCHIRKPNRIHCPCLPSVLIDFTAMTLCDLIPTRCIKNRSLPELVFFVQKITHQANINCRTLLVALIYLQRAKTLLHKRAIGSDDTIHRMFLGSLLIASKFLRDSTWTSNTLTHRTLYEICGGLFSLEEMHQMERAFLKLIRYECWVDDKDVHQFVQLHREDFSI